MRTPGSVTQRERTRHRRGRALLAALLVGGVAVAAGGPTGAWATESSIEPNPRNLEVADDAPHHSAIIDNGVVQLGINDQGHLNLGGGTPSSGTGTTVVGLRYLPTNAESTAPGCLCEGWGAADATSGATGYANISSDGVNNLTLLGFSSGVDAAGDGFAVSEVRIGSTLEVTHDFHASGTPNLYEVTVSMRNISGATVDPRYRRVMDWDIEPTAFSEEVTIQGSSPNLLFSSTNGFQTANPLGSRSFSGYLQGPPGGPEIIDAGPSDHGALFDFGFAPLPPGETVTFNIYYGAAGNETDALNAVDFVNANVFSLGQPSSTNGASLGVPNTFIFGFALGGSSTERLVVRKRADNGISRPGDDNGYSIILSNPTSNPMAVTSVTDLLPPGFTYRDGTSTLDGTPIPAPSPSMVGGRQQLVWTNGFTIAPLSSRTLHFGVRVSSSQPEGVYLNNATAAALIGSAPVAVRATGDAAAVTVPPPTVATDTSATSSTGAITVDPHTGLTEIAMARGSRSPVTVTTSVACPSGTPTGADLVHGTNTYPMTESPPGSGIYTATIPAADIVEAAIVVKVHCPSGDISNTVAVIELYDPSGIITDASTGLPIVGATVTLYKVPFALPDTAGTTQDCRTTLTRPGSDWSGVPAATLGSGVLADPTLSPAEIDPLINPQLTTSEGRYGWNVATGCWFIKVDAAGYESKVSPLVGVPPEVTDLHLALVPIGTPPTPAAVKCGKLLATILGTDGPDVLTGTSGPDVIVGLGGDDVIDGLGGDDIICGGAGNDVIRGGFGNDQMRGELGDDDIRGDGGNDVIWGGAGSDFLRGDAGNDSLRGEAGNDRVYGGAGNDVLTGGTHDAMPGDHCDGGGGTDKIPEGDCESRVNVP